VDDGKRMLYTGNVGDSRAVLCRAGKAIRLTKDHKASLAEEAKRITDAGGFIGRNRVNGVLAITRALGDHNFKENDIVSAEPYVMATEICPEDSLLLLACDGVWDVMTDQEAVEFVAGKFRTLKDVAEEQRDPAAPPLNLNELAENACRALVREALDRRSLDNVTAMLVVL
jgi:serine/threonine protein phosphatase PrpC